MPHSSFVLHGAGSGNRRVEVDSLLEVDGPDLALASSFFGLPCTEAAAEAWAPCCAAADGASEAEGALLGTAHVAGLNAASGPQQPGVGRDFGAASAVVMYGPANLASSNRL